MVVRLSDGYSGLAHQPDSLDDLDNDTIPFDNIPVRYDATGKKCNKQFLSFNTTM